MPNVKISSWWTTTITTVSTVKESHEREAFLRSNVPGNDDSDAASSHSADAEVPLIPAANAVQPPAPQHDVIGLRETVKLSFEFCVLWFIANYSLAMGLEHTTVASSTILLSTSSIWTLVFGALVRVENFKIRKLFGVLGSLLGIILISAVDVSGDTDKNRGSFPHKSYSEIAIGDSLSVGSAIIYGIYTVLMKKRVGKETRVNMFLFFGFVGVLNTILLWPGFVILHLTGVEYFMLPPSSRVWRIVLVSVPDAASTIRSDARHS